MQISTLFTRAWQQQYLTPAERSIYKFIMALLILIPPAALLAGLDFLLKSAHAQVPGWLWSIIGVLVPALLFMLAKYVSAQKDVAVGEVLLQLQAGAQADITTINKQPEPIILPTNKQPPQV